MPVRKSFRLEKREWEQVVQSLQLTPRESEIVALLLKGRSDKQIASALGMSFHTVRTHFRHIFARESINDRLELVLTVFAILRHDSAD